jgi:ornithine carbamoyltransferase
VSSRDTVSLWPADLLSVADLTHLALDQLLDLAAALKCERADGRREELAGQAVATFYDPPTTGQSVALGLAADRLGMLPLELPRAELELGSGEPLADIARTYSALAAALATDAIPHRTLQIVADAATVPVINVRSDRHRPCQALADLLTLRERFGDLSSLALAFVGDARDPIAHSLVEAGALAGMDVRVACPPSHAPDSLILEAARIIAERHGARVSVGTDPYAAVAGADAVYTCAWTAVDAVPNPLVYQVHPGLMTRAHHHAVFMHCLPANRGQEVSSHVIDGDRSLVWEQVVNRVPTLEATLLALAGAA